nr:hypothetical protein KitaXyl93_28050 [Kitasatospora sp. Xyl93]
MTQPRRERPGLRARNGRCGSSVTNREQRADKGPAGAVCALVAFASGPVGPLVAFAPGPVRFAA